MLSRRPFAVPRCYRGLSVRIAVRMSAKLGSYRRGMKPFNPCRPSKLVDDVSSLADRAREFEGALPVREPAVQLRLFHGEQDLLEPGAGRDPHTFQVIARD